MMDPWLMVPSKRARQCDRKAGGIWVPILSAGFATGTIGLAQLAKIYPAHWPVWLTLFACVAVLSAVTAVRLVARCKGNAK